MANKQLQFSFFHWLYDRFTQLVIYPSIWVAAAIASLGIYTQEILGLERNWQAIALIFTSGLIPYNLDRIIASYVQKIPDRKAQLFFCKPYIWILLLAAIFTTAALLFYAPINVKYASVVGLVPLLYGTPFFPMKNESQWQLYRLKDIPSSKAWIVGGVLTYAVIILPLAYAKNSFDYKAALVTIFMFAFIVTNSHIFDIRDLESDKNKGVITLPIMVGLKKAKIILTAINFLMLIILVCAWLANLMPYSPEIVLATIVNIIYIWLVNLHTPRWVYNVLIESFLFIPTFSRWFIYNLFN